MNFLTHTLTVGLIATLVMDAWGLLRKPLLGMPIADYRMPGRWVLGLRRGQVRHAAIGAAPPERGEVVAGWLLHYVTGIAFAAALLALVGEGWRQSPTITPALVFGLVTVVVPFFVMQPAMGLGIAGSRTPRPVATRVQSLMTHAVFGVGLYIGAWVSAP